MQRLWISNRCAPPKQKAQIAGLRSGNRRKPRNVARFSCVAVCIVLFVLFLVFLVFTPAAA